MNSAPDKVPARLGIFGGVFDPVHLGHIQVAEAVFSEFRLDSVIFIPAGQPPHKRLAMASPEHRLHMLEIALKDKPGFTISGIELGRSEISFSVHTLEALHRIHPGDEFFFIMGLDAFLDLETWYRPRRILELAHLVVVFRPPWRDKEALRSPYIPSDGPAPMIGMPGPAPEVIEARSVSGSRIYFLQGPRCDVSSSHIRALLAAGDSVRGLLPEGVQSYILSNKLYEVP